MQPKMQFHLNINQLFPLECVCVCVCAFVCVVATRFVEPPPPPPQNRTQFKSQNGTFIPNHIKSLNGKTQEKKKKPLGGMAAPRSPAPCSPATCLGGLEERSAPAPQVHRICLIG